VEKAVTTTHPELVVLVVLVVGQHLLEPLVLETLLLKLQVKETVAALVITLLPLVLVGVEAVRGVVAVMEQEAQVGLAGLAAVV
jgi:hypothetical protein